MIAPEISPRGENFLLLEVGSHGKGDRRNLAMLQDFFGCS